MHMFTHEELLDLLDAEMRFVYMRFAMRLWSAYEDKVDNRMGNKFFEDRTFAEKCFHEWHTEKHLIIAQLKYVCEVRNKNYGYAEKMVMAQFRDNQEMYGMWN